MITGDEKWIIYNNVKQKRSWSKRDKPAQNTSKADIHQRKVMLSVWWDFKGIVYFELLARNQTINSDIYYYQLDKLNDSIKQKRSELTNRKSVVLHHDNAKPHASLVTRQKLLQLGWDVLPHSSYSPDIAHLSDYHLFYSLQNAFNGKIFAADEDVKLFLELFFAEKNKNFFERRIMKLLEKWQKIIE